MVSRQTLARRTGNSADAARITVNSQSVAKTVALERGPERLTRVATSHERYAKDTV